MASHARHARPKRRRIPRCLVRAGLAVSAAGTALAAGGANTAGAAPFLTAPDATPQARHDPADTSPAAMQEAARHSVKGKNRGPSKNRDRHPGPDAPEEAAGRHGNKQLSWASGAAEGLLKGGEKTLSGGARPVKDFHLDPLAGTGTDPLNNTLGTQIADFKPLTTAIVTKPVTDGGALRDLPVTGMALDLLPD
ncbi:hypothetical protein [Streptomyces sp. MST-110588]|uniref:hypothetical protein n=1 Tax=Streptomyces sp. MST-110588 TaxID=2833628 RepID=UPI001F5E0BD6|nr:hypothetical protein [Streptomyces sp. MST-110588]UNO40233.1 hypothetical protein KGS77_12395 [Streptomyces sp. MST-110588]